eukprot:scaffold252360_cov21-Tisochrysis_lutea.AAC.1
MEAESKDEEKAQSDARFPSCECSGVASAAANLTRCILIVTKGAKAAVQGFLERSVNICILER